MKDTIFYVNVIFSGNVQGVGFRYSTASVAKKHPITGFVKNLPDGTVELEAEGNKKEVLRFIEALKDFMSSYIQKTKEINGSRTAKFKSFDITY